LKGLLDGAHDDHNDHMDPQPEGEQPTDEQPEGEQPKGKQPDHATPHAKPMPKPKPSTPPPPLTSLLRMPPLASLLGADEKGGHVGLLRMLPTPPPRAYPPADWAPYSHAAHRRINIEHLGGPKATVDSEEREALNSWAWDR